MKNRCLGLTIIILSLSFVWPGAAKAEEEPTPGVARISLIHGDVSTQRGDSGDWLATAVNAPVVQGDKVSTGARSRAELQLDFANILRLDQRSEAKIADLTRTRIQVQLAQGVMNFTVLKGTEADVEIDTPNMAVHPLGEGSYRVQVNSSSETEVTVHKGQAEVSTPQGSTTVEKNQLITIQGTDNPQYQMAKARARDEWDEWNLDRDHLIRDAESWRHTNRYYTGAQDLDRYGHWTSVPEYGDVWSPDVGPDWAPYRSGRWVWEPFWGWTWASYEPWGWAPYHYGRWFYYGDSWSWWPGFVTPTFFPAWSPAWVSFIGFGFGRHFFSFGLGFGFGSIGWCPLGPFDPFFPWWGFGNTFNVINITNITNVRNVTNVTNVPNGTALANNGSASNLQAALTNVHVRRAITTVSAQDFVNGRAPRSSQTVSAATLRQAQVVQGTLPAVPTRNSLRPVNRPVSVASMSARTNSGENFFTRRQPPAGLPSFQDRVAEIQRMMQSHNPAAEAQASRNRPVNGTSPNTFGAVSTRQGIPSDTLTGRQPFGQLTTNEDRKPKVGPAQAEHTAQNTSTGGPQRDRIKPAPTAREPEGPAWKRFGQGGAPSIPMAPRQDERGSGPSRPQPSQDSLKPQPEAPTNHPSWQHFSNSGNAGHPAPSEFTPRENKMTAPAPRQSFEPRPAPPARGEEQEGWGRFTPQPRAVPSERGSGPSTPRPEASQPGWNRFSPKTEGAGAPRGERDEGWSSPAPREPMSVPRRWEAPRSSDRPPLEIRKPIVTERAPRGFEGGSHGSWGSGNRAWTAPSGGNRTWSAPSGGGRGGTSPAPSPSHSESHVKR